VAEVAEVAPEGVEVEVAVAAPLSELAAAGAAKPVSGAAEEAA